MSHILEQMVCKVKGHNNKTTEILKLPEATLKHFQRPNALQALYELLEKEEAATTTITYCSRCFAWTVEKNPQI